MVCIFSLNIIAFPNSPFCSNCSANDSVFIVSLTRSLALNIGGNNAAVPASFSLAPETRCIAISGDDLICSNMLEPVCMLADTLI